MRRDPAKRQAGAVAHQHSFPASNYRGWIIDKRANSRCSVPRGVGYNGGMYLRPARPPVGGALTLFKWPIRGHGETGIDMDIRQLKYFLMIAEQGNYARAAEVLGVTQSALTQSMMRLEEELEVRLFERGRFGAELTDVGEALLHRAKLIIAEMRSAESEIKDMRGATRGSVTVGIGKSLASSYIARILVEFASQRPDVSLTINEGWSLNLFRDLAAGEFDFVVSGPQPGVKIDPDLHLEPISHQVEMPVISVRHPLAKKPNPQISDLSDLMWGLPPKGNRRIRRLREIFQSLGLQPPVHFLRTDSDTLALAMIKEGLIVGLANLDTLEREIREKSVIVLPFEELKIDRQIVIVKRRRSRLTPVAEVLYQQIKEGLAPAAMVAAQ